MATDLKSLAKKIGVSPATVSLALNNDPRVAAATKEKIQRLAEKLHYTPSHIGRALQSQKSYLLGYLLSNVTSSFYSDLMQGISEAAAEAGYGLLAAVTDASIEREEHFLRLFKEKRIDGILVSSFRRESRATLLSIKKSGVPLVACSLPTFAAGIPSIIIDNLTGGTMAAEHLIQLGHKQLAYCFTADSTLERYQGACRAARAHQLQAPRLCVDEKELAAVLAHKNRPTGILAYSDLDAIRIKHAVNSCGLQVPRDVSIVGFDDLWFTDLPEFKFTTIAQPKREIGRRAVEMVLQMIKGRKVRRSLIEPRLVVRESTAPPLKS